MENCSALPRARVDANWHLNGQLAYPILLEGILGELHKAYSLAGRAKICYTCLKESAIIGESTWAS